jgi:hypothetical protein
VLIGATHLFLHWAQKCLKSAPAVTRMMMMMMMMMAMMMMMMMKQL